MSVPPAHRAKLLQGIEAVSTLGELSSNDDTHYRTVYGLGLLLAM